MVSELAIRLLEHPKRTWIVWGITCLFAFVFALPAWDQYAEAKTEVQKLQGDIEDVKLSISNLKPMRDRVALIAQQADHSSMIDAEKAEDLREQLVQLAHGLHCRIRRVTLSDPIVRPWSDGDNPFDPTTARTNEKPPYRLETRKLDLLVYGSISKLTRLVTGLSKMNRFAVPTRMIMKREGERKELSLEVDISLFGLTSNND